MNEDLNKGRAILGVTLDYEPGAESSVCQAAFAGTNCGEIKISHCYLSFAAPAVANPGIVADPKHEHALEALVEVDREVISHTMVRGKTPAPTG